MSLVPQFWILSYLHADIPNVDEIVLCILCSPLRWEEILSKQVGVGDGDQGTRISQEWMPLVTRHLSRSGTSQYPGS